MSKGLEALQRLYNESNRDFGWEREEQHKKDKAVIEKELKALEIIKEKQIDVLYIVMHSSNLKSYNEHVSFIGNDKWCLTEEEFDLLKKVLL